MNRLFSGFFRILLPLALLLAQHGVWAHGFGHDRVKMAAHGQVQDHASHACCLPFQAPGDAACGMPRAVAAMVPALPVHVSIPSGQPGALELPYAARAPPIHF